MKEKKFDFKFKQTYEIVNEDFKVMLFEIEERGDGITERFDKHNQKEMEGQSL